MSCVCQSCDSGSCVCQSRVTVCMQRVEDVWDLKYCTDGVQTALQDEDYEKVSSMESGRDTRQEVYENVLI